MHFLACCVDEIFQLFKQSVEHFIPLRNIIFKFFLFILIFSAKKLVKCWSDEERKRLKRLKIFFSFSHTPTSTFFWLLCIFTYPFFCTFQTNCTKPKVSHTFVKSDPINDHLSWTFSSETLHDIDRKIFQKHTKKTTM